MLANRADLRITDASAVTYDFLLDSKIESNWEHRFEDLNANRQVGAGLPGIENLVSWKLQWFMTNWDGGENARYYNPQDPVQYDYATSGNSRVTGVLKGTPAVAQSSYDPTGACGAKAFTTTAAGLAWLACANHATTGGVASSSDLVTWTERDMDLTGGNTRRTTAIAGDGKYCYVAYYDTTASTRFIKRCPASGTGSRVTSDESTAFDILGMAVAGPYLYLVGAYGYVKRVDITQVIGGGGVDEDLSGWSYNTGLDASSGFAGMTLGSSIWVMVAVAGTTVIHEIAAPVTANPVGSPRWALPPGFTGTAIGHVNGVIYVAGYFGNATTNRVCLYGMAEADQVPQRIGYIRVENAAASSLTPVAIAPGEGSQVQIAMSNGSTFIYDSDADSISLLATDTSFTALDGCTSYGGKRVQVFRKSSDDTVRVNAYSDDFATSTSGFDLFTPTWDYSLPYLKQLSSIEVDYKPITGSETIIIKYQLDESGSYTALTTINSSSTGASTGRTTLTGSTVASMKKFRKISFEFVGTGGAELRSISAVSEVVDNLEIMDAAIWIVDQDKLDKPTSKQLSAQAQLDLFFNSSTGLTRLKNMVTLTNGAESPKPGDVTTHAVRVFGSRFVRRGMADMSLHGYEGLEGTLYVRFVVEP